MRAYPPKIEWTPAPSNPSRLTGSASEKVPEWHPKKVQVLRIPVSGPPWEKLTLETTPIDRAPDVDEETAATEQWFQHVPDIRDYKDAYFDWNNRRLVAAYVNDRPYDKTKRWWCIYKCDKPTSTAAPPGSAGVQEKKKENPIVKNIKGAKAFGDIWLFKLKDTEEKTKLDRLGRIAYEKTWELPDEEDVCLLVSNLARC